MRRRLLLALLGFPCLAAFANPLTVRVESKDTNYVQFSTEVTPGRGYVVESATRLTNWVQALALYPRDAHFVFGDFTPAYPQRFFRVVDRTDSMPVPENDRIETSLFLNGERDVVDAYNTTATAQLGEPFTNTVWFTWLATNSAEKAIVIEDARQQVAVYQTTSLTNRAVLSTNGYFNSGAGTNYHFAVGGRTSGPFRLSLTTRPAIEFDPAAVRPVSRNEGESISFSVNASDADGAIASVDFRLNGTLLRSLTSPPFSVVITNLAPGSFIFSATATDNDRATNIVSHAFTVTPRSGS